MLHPVCCSNPLHCILPPYLLDRLEQIDQPEVKQWLAETRRESAVLRSLRMGFDPELSAHLPRAIAASTIATRAGKNRQIYDAQSGGIASLPGRLVRGGKAAPAIASPRDPAPA